MKNFRKYLAITTLLVSSMIVMSSCNKDDDNPNPGNSAENEKSVVQVATSNDDFSILVEALTKADLVTALQGDGPFTVFAPTNQAFEDLFTALNVNGIEDLSAETLKPILLYHVVGAAAKSSSLNTGYYETLNTTAPDEEKVKILVEIGGNVMINGSTKVTAADIEASNGVVHVIDKVLLPPTVVALAISNANFSILVDAVVKAGLVDALKAEGPFTIFAPTNAAFEALFIELNVSGIMDLSAEALTPILLYHVVSGNVTSKMVSTGMVPTLNQDAELDVKASESGVMINGSSNVIAVDVQGTNGVIHALDKVLLP